MAEDNHPHHFFMNITIPEGLDLKVGEGETTELLAKVKVTADGLTLLELDGVALPVEEEVEEVETEVEGEDLDALLAGMGAEEEVMTEKELPSQEEYFASKK